MDVKKILALFSIIISQANAANLTECLEKFYASPNITAIQEDLKATHENYYQTFASHWLPKISLDYSKGKKGAWAQGDGSYLRNSETQQISVSQPILKGGAAITSLKIVDLNMQIAHQQYLSQEQDLFLRAISAYLEVIKRKELLKASEISEKSFEQYYASSKDREKLGEITKTNLALSKARFENAKAQRAKAFAQYKASIANFENLFGFAPDNLDEPSDFIDQNIISQELSNLLFNNPTLKAYKIKTKVRDLQVKANVTKFMPQVTFNAFASKTRQNYIKNSSPSKAKGWTIDVSIPLYNGGTDLSAFRQNKSEHLAELSKYNYVLNETTSNFSSEIENFKASKLALEAAGESVKASELALEAIKEEFKLGTKTILLVLDTETDLYKDKVEYVNRSNEYLLSYFNVRKLLGQLSSKELNLNVPHFNYEKHLQQTKLKFFSFNNE